MCKSTFFHSLLRSHDCTNKVDFVTMDDKGERLFLEIRWSYGLEVTVRAFVASVCGALWWWRRLTSSETLVKLHFKLKTFLYSLRLTLDRIKTHFNNQAALCSVHYAKVESSAYIDRCFRTLAAVSLNRYSLFRDTFAGTNIQFLTFQLSSTNHQF